VSEHTNLLKIYKIKRWLLSVGETDLTLTNWCQVQSTCELVQLDTRHSTQNHIWHNDKPLSLELTNIKKQLKPCSVLNGNPSQNYMVSLAIWNHTMLLATQHKRTHPALTPASEGWYSINLPQRDGRLSWPRWLVTYRDGLPISLSNQSNCPWQNEVFHISKTYTHIPTTCSFLDILINLILL